MFFEIPDPEPMYPGNEAMWIVVAALLGVVALVLPPVLWALRRGNARARAKWESENPGRSWEDDDRRPARPDVQTRAGEFPIGILALMSMLVGASTLVWVAFRVFA